MNIVLQAIEIITDDGYGFSVSNSDSSIGLVSGHFYWISGSPGLDGSKTVTGDTSQTTWYENILADGGSISLTQNAEMTVMGCLAAAGNLGFQIQNTALFQEALSAMTFTDILGNTNTGLDLYRCQVKYYRVTSSDNSMFDFFQRSLQIIDKLPYNELSYKIQCLDASKGLFETTPSLPLSYGNYPTIPQTEQQAFIPICFGRVAYAPMVIVSGSGFRQNLISLINYPLQGDVSAYTTCAAIGYYEVTGEGFWIDLITPGINFLHDDTRLVGNYLNIVDGGSQQSILIKANSVTRVKTVYPPENDNVYYTSVLLQSPFDTTPVLWPGIGSEKTGVWYFEVVEFSAVLVVSQNPVYQFVKNGRSIPRLFTGDSNTVGPVDISEIQNSFNTSNVDSVGYPGFEVVANDVNGNGSVDAYFSIQPQAVTYNNTKSDEITSTSLPAYGTNCPNLLTGVFDPSVYYSVVSVDPFAVMKLVLEVFFPSLVLMNNQAWDNIYLVFDAQHKASTTDTLYIKMSINGYDVHFRELAATINDYELNPPGTFAPGTSFGDFYLLPNNYYGISAISNTRDDHLFFSNKVGLDISALINTVKKTSAYNKMEMTVNIHSVGGGSYTYTMRLMQVGFVAKKTVTFSSESLFATTIGEIFGSTWDSADRTRTITPTDPVLLVGDVIERLIRVYAYPYPAWTASTSYAVGALIKTVEDNGHIYFCTVAGISDTSEPAFPTTSGGTVTDGTVTWKEWKTIAVDLVSFDNISGQRSNTFVGYSLTASNTLSGYLKDIAAQTFLGIYQNRYGNIAVKSWIDNQTPLVTFSESNGIIQDSIGDRVSSDMLLVYNCGPLRYDYNPITKQYNKQLTISAQNLRQPVFPPQYVPIGDLIVIATTTNFTAKRILYTGIDSAWQIQIVTTSPHGLVTGNYATLQGSSGNYDFTSLPVTVQDANTFYVFTLGFPSLINTNTGTLYQNTTYISAWQNFIGGIGSYGTAARIWNLAKASTKVTKGLRPFTDAMSNAFWLIDPVAADPNGNPFWPDLVGAGDNHPAVTLLFDYLSWSAWPKDEITFDVNPDTPLNDSSKTAKDLTLFDCVAFNDQKQSGGVDVIGWVNSITDVPNSANGNGKLKLKLMLLPTKLPDAITAAGGNRLFDSPLGQYKTTDSPTGIDGKLYDSPGA